MICATRDIILLNKRLNKESRRDVYVPVQISGVSIYDARQSTKEGTIHSQSDDFKIRIPIDADVQGDKAYIPETQYDGLDDNSISDLWTLHTEDAIIVCAASFDDVDTAAYTTDDNGFITEQEAEQLAAQYGFQKQLIHITGYSDNTMRGSKKLKHWRIGGA